MKFIQGVTNYQEWRDHARDNGRFQARMAVITELLPHKNELAFADQVRLAQQIVVSELSGKLDGFYAGSTSVLMNPICQARAKCEGCICKDCYAASGASRYSTLAQSLETNYIILNNFLLPEDALATIAIPTTNGKTRIEAHGDVATEICAINYVRMIRAHKHLTFAVWTKNLNLYKRVLDVEGKPENMIFIASSPIVNEVMEMPKDMRQYVDHVFTVFDPVYAKTHNIVINCGTWEGHDLDHRCKNCGKCYDQDNTDFYINELKK